MVVIRLARGGSKKRPFYHLHVTDSRSPRDGRYIERIGYFNPIARGAEVPLHIDLERVDYWLSEGAKPSDRVATLIKQAAQTSTSPADKPQVSASTSKPKQQTTKQTGRAAAESKPKPAEEAQPVTTEESAAEES